MNKYLEKIALNRYEKHLVETDATKGTATSAQAWGKYIEPSGDVAKAVSYKQMARSKDLTHPLNVASRDLMRKYRALGGVANLVSKLRK